MPEKDEPLPVAPRRAHCEAELYQFVAALTAIPISSQDDADSRGLALAAVVCAADECSTLAALRRGLEAARDLYVSRCVAAWFEPLIADQVKLLLGDSQSSAIAHALYIYQHAFPDRPVAAGPLEQRLSMLLTNLEFKAQCLERVRDLLLEHESRVRCRADGSLPIYERLDKLLSLIPTPRGE